jgi:hypothetical protein
LRLTFAGRLRFDCPRVGIGIHSPSLPQTHSSTEGEYLTRVVCELTRWQFGVVFPVASSPESLL